MTDILPAVALTLHHNCFQDHTHEQCISEEHVMLNLPQRKTLPCDLLANVTF